MVYRINACMCQLLPLLTPSPGVEVHTNTLCKSQHSQLKCQSLVTQSKVLLKFSAQIFIKLII